MCKIMCERSRLMQEIGILCFVTVELGLYLDTHPDDREAMRYFHYYTALKNEKSDLYNQKFGPLTLSDVKDSKDCENEFLWTVQPWPWEGGME